MADVIGLIQTSIELANTLYGIAEKYVEAPKSAAQMHLFSGQLSTVRLNLLHTALTRNIKAVKFTGRERSHLEKALEELNEGLDEAISYLRDRAPANAFRRLQWAFWTESGAIKLFDEVQARLDVLQGIVSLAKLAPELTSLADSFKIPDPDKANYLTNTQTGYCTEADWKGPNNVLQEVHREPLRVFVESNREVVGDSDTEEQKKEKRNQAIAQAKVTAERLWWSCGNETSFQTGLLPCIGFSGYRVIFLLPKNAERPQTLGELVRNSKTDGPWIGVSVEARFALALQLAEAVLKIHSAGLTHRAIRSDTVLFLAPRKEQSDPTTTDNSSVRGSKSKSKSNSRTKSKARSKYKEEEEEEEDPAKTNAIRRTKTMQKARRALTRVMTSRKDSDTKAREGSNGRRDDTLKRKDSIKSMRNERATRSPRERGTQGFFKGRRRPSIESLSDVDDNSSRNRRDDPHSSRRQLIDNADIVPTVGDVPPGFGSLYLMYWKGMDYRGEIADGRNLDWAKDIYRHPEQVGSPIRVQHNMGHDIYSLGVCLLEIGLWESFVQVEKGHRVHGRLTKKVGLPETGSNRERVKTRLVQMAEEELPGAMGNRYAQLVKACLRCLDNNTEDGWSVDFTKLKRDLDSKAFRRVVLSVLLDINQALIT